MKFSAVVLALVAAQASAFAPASPARTETALNSAVIKAAQSIVSGSGSTHKSSASTSKKAEGKTMAKIDAEFPGSLSNKELVSRVFDKLSPKGYGRSSLVATSLCCDEITRVLEKDFGLVYNDNFHMGGLSGFPFGGVTSFGAMASHIPDGGSCLVVFGPHVGIDKEGNVGTTERRGRENGGGCCGSALAASAYVAGVMKGEPKMEFSGDSTQAQQIFVSNMLLNHGERLDAASDRMVELPYALYDEQKKMVTEIVKAGAGAVADGNIAVLGGIQINTAPGTSDYYLPLSFEYYNNKGEKLEDLTL